ncbi:hypothetical protein KR009_005711 [Drosophila setifemur]|nr:hypothetical protein KR009_005711 [Drosophila setifemur]
MFRAIHPLLKWLALFLLSGIVILTLLSRNAETQYRKYRAGGVATSNYGIIYAPDTDYIGKIESYNNDTASEPKVALPKYFVETARCKIPYVNPFEADAMAVFHPEHFEVCSNQTALVTPIYDVSKQRYFLRINETLASRILNSSQAEFNCYYQEITGNSKGERKYFSQNYEVPLHVGGFILSCHSLDNPSNILQSDAYTLVQYKKPPKGPSLAGAKRKPSVLMFGIDSLSRINLRRTMPKVYDYLTGPGWYEMQGYNKIGDNTFPNLLATLTGFNPESAQKNVCDWRERGCLDRTPFVWRDFRNAGYLTAYGEDESGMETFNYMKPGFKEQPTDYYARPFQMAFESGLESWKCADCTLRYCIGRRIASSYVYDMAKEFARRYVGDRPIWGFFWSNSFSHDSFQMPSKMEDYVLQYLLDFDVDGVFDQSIFVFMSDHGSRYSQITALPSGFLESRLPAMFIYLPPWFRAQYPEYAESLRVNQNRLTSNYDLHNTLKHIIELGSPANPPLPRSHDCPKCQSLFETMDVMRTCEDAGIPEHYCTCVPYKRISANWAERIAPQIIGRINEYLAGRNLSEICSELTLSYVHETEIKIGLDQNFHDEVPFLEEAVYRTMFKVQQDSADFRATVVFNNLTETVVVDVPTISRLDSYAKVSTCVDDHIDKMYCICKSDLKE